jgi:hypothetical protein
MSRRKFLLFISLAKALEIRACRQFPYKPGLVICSAMPHIAASVIFIKIIPKSSLDVLPSLKEGDSYC